MSVRFIGHELSDPNSGKVIHATAHGDLSKGYPVYITMDSSGYLTKAVPIAGVGIVGVPVSDVASGKDGEFVVEGVAYCYCNASMDAGDGVIPTQATQDFAEGAAFNKNVGQTNSTLCGVALETTSGAGLCLCMLHGYPVTSA